MLQQEALAESGALEDDAFDDVGDVFALVDGGFDDLKDLFPLNDLDGIFSSSKSWAMSVRHRRSLSFS